MQVNIAKLNAKQKAVIKFYREAEANATIGGVGRGGQGLSFHPADKRRLLELMQDAGMSPGNVANALGYVPSTLPYQRHLVRIRGFAQQIERENAKAGRKVSTPRLTIGADAKLHEAIRQREARLKSLKAEAETVRGELAHLKGVISILGKA